MLFPVGVVDTAADRFGIRHEVELDHQGAVLGFGGHD
jgi:hypothetical protein